MNTKLTSLINLTVVIFSLMLSSTMVFGQTGKITGTVTDAESGELLPGVNVVIEGTDQGAATDQDGHYFIVNIEPGTYTVTASMIGYQKVSKTGVLVSTNHTTPVNFELTVTAIAGEAVTIEAEREIVEMDNSASEITVQAEEISETATISTLEDYINTRAGVEGMSIRGGSLDQTQFMVNGLTVVDNRVNQPMMMVNLSAVQELNILKGGFNAEYGNVRSGLVNVVTKEGSPNTYHGSIDFRLSPAHYKHRGPSLFSPQNYYLRPYMDPSVAFVGTKNGDWDEYTQDQYLEFKGWNEYSESLPEDRSMTPEEAQQLFMWQHTVEGSEELGQRPREYGQKPDWTVDASFGGPVPYIGQHLGNLTFFASFRDNWELFGLPTIRDYYKEKNSQLKLTSRPTENIKLGLEGLYGEINSVMRWGGVGMSSGDDILYNFTGKGGGVYYPRKFRPHDLYRSMIGFSFDHVLSSKTFYKLRISLLNINEGGPHPDPAYMRDTTTVRYFGDVPVDETPYGHWFQYDLWTIAGYRVGGMNYPWNLSRTSTLNIKGDFTSQINRYNQIKFGFLFNRDDIDARRGGVRMAWPSDWTIKYHEVPYRAGAYIQDKLEFEGMIANFGLRVDYNDPNTEWFTVDRYSRYFSKAYEDVFPEEAPKEPAKSHLKISPRLGISHPISANSKLYFNYGHFYSMPPTTDMYRVRYFERTGVDELGNPSANLPRTVAYELGFEQNIGNLFLLHVAGYYKDISDQTGEVIYTNYTGTVDYETIENNNYEDIRGFEVRFEKRWGQWVTGWINYNYMATTSGYIGREHYYEDKRLQRREGLQTPYEEKPLPRPIVRTNIRLMTPGNWGPIVAGIRPLSDLSVSILYQWKAGSYMTWDPLETYQLVDNLQWRGRSNMDVRLSKRIVVGNFNVQLFADIHNPFNWKYLETTGFADGSDQREYFESLHLPMYEDQMYQEAGLIPGNDKPGDIRSDEKPYIDMPNLKFRTFFNVRSVFFGLKVDF